MSGTSTIGIGHNVDDGGTWSNSNKGGVSNNSNAWSNNNRGGVSNSKGGQSSGSSGSGSTPSGGQGGGSSSAPDIDDLIDGVDDPNFWLIQKMKQEAEMLAAMQKAARSKKKAFSLLFANASDADDLTHPLKKTATSYKKPVTYKSSTRRNRSIPQFDPNLAQQIQQVRDLIATLCENICRELRDPESADRLYSNLPPECFNFLDHMCQMLCGGPLLQTRNIVSHGGLFERWLDIAENPRGLTEFTDPDAPENQGANAPNHDVPYDEEQRWLQIDLEDWDKGRTSGGYDCNSSGSYTDVTSVAREWSTKPVYEPPHSSNSTISAIGREDLVGFIDSITQIQAATGAASDWVPNAEDATGALQFFEWLIEQAPALGL